MRQPGNGEISSEHPEQVRDVIASNVALRGMGVVSTDLQSPMAIFFYDDYPILTVTAKVITIEFLSKCKVSALQNLSRIDLTFL